MSPPRSPVRLRELARASALSLGLACSTGAPLTTAEPPATPSAGVQPASGPAHEDRAALDGVRERARALVREMTLEEKLAALVHVWDWSNQKTPEELCAVVPAGAGSFERIGLYRDPAATASFVNALRACVTDKSRLHIPPFMLDEGVHGLMQQGATSFPV